MIVTTPASEDKIGDEILNKPVMVFFNKVDRAVSCNPCFSAVGASLGMKENETFKGPGIFFSISKCHIPAHRMADHQAGADLE